MPPAIPPNGSVLFDLDGTIIDSFPGIFRCANETLAAFDVAPVDVSGVRQIIGPPLAETFLRLGIRDEDVVDAIVTYRSLYEADGLFEYELFDGIADVIGALDDAGVTLAVATSKITRTSVRIIEHAGLLDRFFVVLGNEPDGQRGTKTEVITDVLAALPQTSRSRTVMVGDRSHDAEGAAANAVEFVGVTWGYGSVEELRAHGAVNLIDHPRELLVHLDQHQRA
jgi:phosphoglycolate phosphatase-like HAD superfamily hydrolase